MELDNIKQKINHARKLKAYYTHAHHCAEYTGGHLGQRTQGGTLNGTEERTVRFLGVGEELEKAEQEAKRLTLLYFEFMDEVATHKNRNALDICFSFFIEDLSPRELEKKHLFSGAHIRRLRKQGESLFKKWSESKGL